MDPRLPLFNASDIADVPVIFSPRVRGHMLFGQIKSQVLILTHNGKPALRPSGADLLVDLHLSSTEHNFREMTELMRLLRADRARLPMTSPGYNYDSLLRLMKRREGRWSWSAESAQYLADHVWVIWVIMKTLRLPQEKFFRLTDWEKKCDNAMAQLSALLGIATGGDLSGLMSFKSWAGAVVQFERAVCDLSERVST